MAETHALDVQTGSLSRLLETRAKVHASKPFLWTQEGTIAYAEADDRIDRLAAGLQHQGVSIGDRVMLLMDNSASQVLVWLAIERIGGVNVPVNTALGAELLARAIRTVRPSVIVGRR